jgi:hypothetical protein
MPTRREVLISVASSPFIFRQMMPAKRSLGAMPGPMSSGCGWDRTSLGKA